ncbi:putative disease resistance RPP13-like protein 1 [Dichanthelium oligosanthes]|uniref:Putative disease resistance RPP13-like protein 1 n=1 Tax=Dichanthelium oligosanthes TaxID=888268 RepID=A0A1E5UV94_9POAL|nr:putative disease resistance RPP13-like protein 1 [Dichanthelium oligosanthes]
MVGPGLTVGASFAGAVISNFVKKARSILQDNHALQAEAGDMLYSVQAALPRIKILVEVSERKAISNCTYEEWLQQFKDIVYEAEDLLDDFETKRIRDELHRKSSMVGSAASFALRYMRNLLLSDADLGRLKDVLKKLNKIVNDVGGTSSYGMLELADEQEEVRPLPPTRPLIVGRDKEKQDLLSLVCPAAPVSQHGAESSKQFSVIAVVGAAGVGKTTLAQVIYNNQNVKEAFALRGWVLASHRSRDKQDIAKDIADSFGMEQLDKLQKMQSPSASTLFSALENKRFFLVLDDVQDDLRRLWGSLRSILAGAANGSVVLLTTRSEEDAYTFGTTAHVSLDRLPLESMCRVFEHHAFGKQEKGSLESIGKKIVQNLHGISLLAEAIGRLLRQNLDEEHWRKISRSHWWLYSEDDDSQNVALPSVTIVCEHLSDHLRKRLCYCSIFPSGYLFEKKMLIQMWKANFMQQYDGIEMEKKEKKWFDELFNQSFFQPTIWDNKYIIPDMIKEPIYRIAEKECHAATDSRELKRSLQLYRHLAIDSSDFNVHLDFRKANKWRTILFFDGHRTNKLHEALANILCDPSALRLLDFSYSKAKLGKAPDFINKFPHLRFLDLSFTDITVIPDSLCKLHLLQVLGLRGCQLTELPRAMNELVNLRFLYAEAPTVALIYKIGQLTNLLGLEEFPVGRIEGHKITELKDLNDLCGQLCISNLEEVTGADIEADAQLSKKRHLKKLALKWGLEVGASTTKSDVCMRTLAGLKPNSNLKELKIQCYMGVEFPAWMADEQHFTKLRHVHLIKCKQLKTLPPLGQIPSLMILVLEGLSVLEQIGGEFYGTGYRVFPSLEELKFLDMPNWRKWSDIEELQGSRAHPFPHLKKVQLKNCKVLSHLPLCCLQASLEELNLSECNEIFKCSPSCLGGLKSLLRLRIHHCLGRIHLPCDLLASLEVLNLQKCEVYFQGGTEQIIKLKRILTSDFHELNLDELKEVRKGQLVPEVFTF